MSEHLFTQYFHVKIEYCKTTFTLYNVDATPLMIDPLYENFQIASARAVDTAAASDTA